MLYGGNISDLEMCDNRMNGDIATMMDTRWFQDRLMDRGISQRALARHLGLDPAAVSLTLHGKRKLTAQEAADMAVVLDVGIEDVMQKAGLAKGHRKTTGGCPGEGDGDVAGRGNEPCAGLCEAPAGFLELPVPLAGGGVARLVLPERLNEEDAERIAAMVKAFAVAGASKK